jgi:O-antigen/teichoic acid export membrane protein
MSMVAVNYSNDLFTAMRLQRICSRLQMIMASTFTVLGIGLLGWYPQGAQSVLIAFVGGSLASFVAGLPYLWHAWRTEPVSAQPVSQAAFWGKLAPYALSIWATNWLGNAFLLSDRYLLIHYSGMGGDESLVQVGQYHIARLVPMLLLTVAGILTSILLPHLSHDWESGSRSEVSHRMNLFIKVLGLGLLATGAAVLLVAPLAFEVVFHGKYALALAVLPCTLGYCVWAALGYVARTYLWCDERVLLGSVAYAVGLVVSVALSLVLIPTYGLFGAVWATSAGNAVVLVLLMVMSIRHGMEVRQGTWLVLATPLALCLGVWAAVPTAIVTSITLWKTDWLLSQYEKQHLVEFVRRYYRKLKPVAVDEAPLPQS